MDKIQAFLITAGRKDLAQEYYKKTANEKLLSDIDIKKIKDVIKTYIGLELPITTEDFLEDIEYKDLKRSEKISLISREKNDEDTFDLHIKKPINKYFDITVKTFNENVIYVDLVLTLIGIEFFNDIENKSYRNEFPYGKYKLIDWDTVKDLPENDPKAQRYIREAEKALRTLSLYAIYHEDNSREEEFEIWADDSEEQSAIDYELNRANKLKRARAIFDYMIYVDNYDPQD